MVPSRSVCCCYGNLPGCCLRETGKDKALEAHCIKWLAQCHTCSEGAVEPTHPLDRWHYTKKTLRRWIQVRMVHVQLMASWCDVSSLLLVSDGSAQYWPGYHYTPNIPKWSKPSLTTLLLNSVSDSSNKTEITPDFKKYACFLLVFKHVCFFLLSKYYF